MDMSRFLKSFLLSALIATFIVFANPQPDEAQAQRRRYWNNYWNWYNGYYRPYYRYGPGYYSYRYRYPRYSYRYPYTYYYGSRPSWGFRVGPFVYRDWY